MSAQPQPLESTGQRERRGYIEPHALRELWFHTGTACNLECPFCLEGSKPGDNRLGRITLAEAKPFIDEAVALGVEQLSFTGGEPFVVKGFVDILRYASQYKPCLVLTNGTAPLRKRMRQIAPLRAQPRAIAFRVSIDYPSRERHDAGRGTGTFDQSWAALEELHALGFKVSIARQIERGEDAAAVAQDYRALLAQHRLPESTTLVGFPDFLPPGTRAAVPTITEHCMTTFQTEATRRAFMCAFSKMIVKKGGRLRVYACTLVDDDPAYDLGGTLAESMPKRVSLQHHRCYSCFKYGSSCSEIDR
jgi:sulfatase maturation enzyme AslB (radical SAM superfamily)